MKKTKSEKNEITFSSDAAMTRHHGKLLLAQHTVKGHTMRLQALQLCLCVRHVQVVNVRRWIADIGARKKY